MAGRKCTSDRKAMILKMAGKLMWEKGFHATSIRDIARACSFESSNIYFYFTSKEQILLQMYISETNHMIDMVQHLESDTIMSPADQLHFFITSQVTYLAHTSAMSYGLLVDAELRHLSPANRQTVVKLRDQHEMILRRIIYRGIDKGDFVETDVKLLSIMVFSMLTKLVVWYSPQGKLSAEEIANYIYKLVANTIMKNCN